MVGYSMNNWASMPDGKAKYQAYLASREWSALRNQVHARSGGICERCHHNPGDAVHHLNYERIYRELLTDLVHICDPCHEFEHAKRKRDPILDVPVKLCRREIHSVYLAGRISPPHGAWRIQVAPDWNESGCGSSGMATLDNSLNGLYANIPDGREIEVVGPFWADMIPTGGGHAFYSAGDAIGIHAVEGAFVSNSHGQFVPNGIPAYRVRDQILRWLRKADLVFAWIEDRECYGTLLELGLVVARPDTIVVVATPAFDRELWLPTAMANILIYAPTAGEAWAKLWSGHGENLLREFICDSEAWDAYHEAQYRPDEEESEPEDDGSEDPR